MLKRPFPEPQNRVHNPAITSISHVSTQPQLHHARSWLGELRVGQKIAVGYMMALGVAIVGISGGLSLSSQYRAAALDTREDVLEEIESLQTLQTSLLQARIHQQSLVSLAGMPDRIATQQELFDQQAKDFQRSWFDVLNLYEVDAANVSDQERNLFNVVVELHNQSVGQYFRETRSLLGNLDEATNAETADVRARFIEFERSNLVADLNLFSQTLDELIDQTLQDGDVAEDALTQAETTSTRIIVVSFLMSVMVAIAMVIFTSRAIAQPIQTVTAIAKKSAEDSDFSLQAPVTSHDEVGTLAISINHLIKTVEHLLNDLKHSTAQQLIASEKMSSLGEMLAGVAHEINNPVNFIYGNVIHANDYVNDLLDLIHLYQSELDQSPLVVQDKAEAIDLEFIEEDLPRVLQSMKVGADRTRQIVLSLRNFSRMDETRSQPVNLHECLDSTLLILHNRIKSGINLVRQYGDIPDIEGYPGPLYQVFTNLISNAIDALSEQSTPSPTITISTDRQGDRINVRIEDNGPGIPAEHLSKIFNTFFTTKPTGKGTGLGLSICRQIVEQKHRGELSCQSTLGVGTTFQLRLPIQLAIAPNTASIHQSNSAKPNVSQCDSSDSTAEIATQ
jgi:signal transduction histidine kinase